MMYKEPYVIAEIGCNHKGDIEIAKEMIEVAAIFCKVDAVKFQKRCPKELLTEEEYNAPHPVPYNSYGETYGQHREALEFTAEQHKILMDWCDKFRITYSTSVWDMTSAKEIVALNPKFIKVPSACNLNRPMLEYLCKNFAGDIHLSVGMTNHEEEKSIVELFKSFKRNKDLVLYACTSGYPVPPEDICLLEIKRLVETYGEEVKAIGFSNHNPGISFDTVGYAFGAQYFERHFTLNRTWKGTDHAASLEPDGMRRVARDLRNTQKALTYKSKEILNIEEVQRKKLKHVVDWN